NEGKVMRCKKCQELLFFIRSQEKLIRDKACFQNGIKSIAFIMAE
ncbi:hemerythrin, partial [Campylobacter coli]|nr:hemerythrin [Campylobacter coli]